MRVLYLDIDTLRPDHLGCYGYHRNTSPNIDRIAGQGVRFDNCYVSDAPCLPSRASMFTGQFGIHNGVVNHGGLAADLRPIGRDRGFNIWRGFVPQMRKNKLYPVSFSPFAERHSAFWFYQGWREMYNSGKGGNERADEIVPAALDWIGRNADRDNWMLHVNIWDPHTPYRCPAEFGNPFADQPLSGWYTEEIRQRQWNSFGPGTPQEPAGEYGRDLANPRQPRQVASMDDYRAWVDGYDCGIRYADEWCGRILNALADQGVLDDTAIIITSDHGENFGELGVIGDHQLADQITSRVPMIIRWPGVAGGRVDSSLHYQTDIAATMLQLMGGEIPPSWDGRGFAQALRDGRSEGRDSLVVSQCAWSCQRSARWDDYLFIRTYHTGLKNLPARMLFNVKEDPHEQHNLVDRLPALADHGQALIEQWTAQMMATSSSVEDPLWVTMREGGPYHTRPMYEKYLQRLRETGRGHHADFLQAHPTGLVD